MTHVWKTRWGKGYESLLKLWLKIYGVVWIIVAERMVRYVYDDLDANTSATMDTSTSL